MTLNLQQPRAVIIGCGSIGGVVAGRLIQAGYDVVGISNNEKITEAMAQDGLTVMVEDGQIQCPFDVATSFESLDASSPFDVALLCVPPNACKAAIEDALPHLHEEAPIVCMPNGLVEEQLARFVDERRLVGGVVGFGGERLDLAHVRQTSSGGFVLGRLRPNLWSDGDPQLDAISAMLAHVGPIQRSENLRGARWSKLAINCAISSLGTIGGDRLGVLMRHRFVRRLALEVMTEVVQIAHAEEVQLEKVAGTLNLDWMALTDEDRIAKGSSSLLLKHTVLLAVGTKFRKMRSSMLAAIERGRTPPVDFLNGEITSRAEQFNIPTPINARVQQTVHAIARKEMSSGVDTLRALYASSRTDVPQKASQVA